MNDVKLFERWIKNSIKDRLIVQVLETAVVLTNGFIVYKIDRSDKVWMEAIKSNTFQELENNFMITRKKIEHGHNMDIIKVFKVEKQKPIEDVNLVYKNCGKNLMIFKDSEGQYIFVDLNNIDKVTQNLTNFEVKGGSDTTPITLTQDKVQIGICPVRISAFPYDIIKK